MPSFVQEPEYDEGANPSDISQYPLEDILDKFYVSVSDFYERENYNKEEEGYINCLLNKSEQQIGSYGDAVNE